MKKIALVLMTLAMCLTLSSCVTTAQAQVDDMYGDADISVVVTYGTPFYNAEGLLLYYVYRDVFYYPYFYHNRYYLHRYSRPLPPTHMYRYRPVPRDVFKPYHRPNHGYHNWNGHGTHHHNGGLHNPNVGGRPNTHTPSVGGRSHPNNRGTHTPSVGGISRPSGSHMQHGVHGSRPSSHGNSRMGGTPRSSTRSTVHGHGGRGHR